MKESIQTEYKEYTWYFWYTWATWYTRGMDIHIRNVKESTWRHMRLRSVKDGISLSELLDRMWASYAPRATSSPSKPIKSKIVRNTVESQPVKLKKRKSQTTRILREFGMVKPEPTVTIDSMVVRQMRQIGKNPDDLLLLDDWELDSLGLTKVHNVIKIK